MACCRSCNVEYAILPVTASPALHFLGCFSLQDRLADSLNYIQQYTYQSYPAANFEVPYTIDPTAYLGAAAGPTNGTWRVVGNSGSTPVHALPFTNELVLFMQRTSNSNGSSYDSFLNVDNNTQSEIAAIYNMTDNTFRPFHITEHPFCSAQTLLPNGQGIIVGGDPLNLIEGFLTNGLQTVRVFDPATQTYQVVGEMERGRWYPSVTVLADGDLLIVGGMQQEAGGWAADESPSTTSQPTVKCAPNTGGSIADPSYDNPTYQIMSSTNYSLSPALTLTILLQSWPINSYPFLAQLPQGSVLIIAGSLMDTLLFGVDGASRDNSTGMLPTLPVPVNYPMSAAFTLMPLQGPDYNASAFVAGGNDEYCANAMSAGGSKSWLFDVSPGADHSLIEEALSFPRVMGEMTLLPDGRVFLCNGAQVGIAGGAGPNEDDASNGATIGEIYDPSKPVGQRWSQVADSMIWRLYHSEAFLTSNAEVFVSGSESTDEHRVQIYTPDYLYTSNPRPVITAVNGSAQTAGVYDVDAQVGYSQNFTIGFSGVTTLDRVVFNRLVGSTHGVHADQRQIVLDCSVTTGTAICSSPPNNYIAPPGVYMLFVLNQGVPSRAKYISLQLAGTMTKLPATATAG
ncbi:TPA: hypothetical protein ACH3X2_013911 [Trebouxia sp. C0005]